MYKRLTKRYEDKYVVDPLIYIEPNSILSKVTNRLAELEDKIENGTLIELPCKVGDWLYYIYENKIHKAKVEEIKFNVYKHGIKNESIDIFAYDFKNKLELSFYYKEDFSRLDTETIDFVKTFLTKAEAEQKLLELRGGV